MDPGLFAYTQKNNTAGVLANIGSLKETIYNQTVGPGDVQEKLKSLNIQDQISQIGGEKSLIEGIGSTFDGVVTAGAAAMNSKKLISLAKKKLGIGEKGSKASEAKNVEKSSDDAVSDGTKSTATNDSTSSSSTTAPEASDTGSSGSISYTETPLEPTASNVPQTELGSTEVSTEPAGTGEGDIELTSLDKTSTQSEVTPAEFGDNAGNTAEATATTTSTTVEETTEAATGAAEGLTDATIATTEVAAETVGGFLDAIPIVGEIAGAIVGVGAAIWGAVETAKESSLESEDTTDEANQVKTDSAAAATVAQQTFTGSTISNTLSSLSSMPTTMSF